MQRLVSGAGDAWWCGVKELGSSRIHPALAQLPILDACHCRPLTLTAPPLACPGPALHWVLAAGRVLPPAGALRRGKQAGARGAHRWCHGHRHASGRPRRLCVQSWLHRSAAQLAPLVSCSGHTARAGVAEPNAGASACLVDSSAECLSHHVCPLPCPQRV